MRLCVCMCVCLCVPMCVCAHRQLCSNQIFVVVYACDQIYLCVSTLLTVFESGFSTGQ